MKKALFAIAVFLTVCGIAALVGWGDSPSASCAQIPGKAGAAPQPTAALQPAASAAKEAGAKDAKPATALKHESVIPKRELVFDQSEDEVTCLYFPSAAAGEVAKMVQEERYVASVVLKFGVPDSGPDQGPYSRGLPPSFYHVMERPWEHPQEDSDSFLDLRSLGSPSLRLSEVAFNRLASRVPAERLPPSDVIEMLASQLRLRSVGGGSALPEEVRAMLTEKAQALLRARRAGTGRPSQGGDFSEPMFSLSARAPTADRAKDLVRALLVVFDYGASVPKYENYVELRQYYESKLPECQAAAKGPEEKYTEAQKALEKFNEAAAKDRLTKEELAALISQQRLIAVEEAGLNARIAASDRILKERRQNKIPLSRVEHVEIAKTVAEIELVGLAAKRAAIQEIVDRERKRTELTANRNTLAEQLAYAKRGVEEAKRRLAMYSTAVEQKMPFAEVEGKVFIRRIKWEERTPPSGPRSGAPSPSPRSPATRGKSK